MMRRCAGLLFCLVAGSTVLAGGWPNWRGPGLNGVASGSGYPTHWSKAENVAWTFDLPGKGASTPVVWGDRIVLTCAIKGQNGVFCLGRDGKPLWQKTIGSGKP